jgi:hypothetical protein
MKTRKKNKVGISSSYFKLVDLLSRCVEISEGFWAFSFFLHKEINKKKSPKNEHLYTYVVSSHNFLLGETPKKRQTNFFIKGYILLHSERIIKVGFPNIKCDYIYESKNFYTFFGIDH